ncbi:solute carrier family 23 member 2 [Folsomia candida]|uniref:Solute carrier family 23 member 2 n=1 Tax=Folsomia candida TaxID=158441 RepID=A0A226EKV5_FOLCA|nr:solute carrier family 23 member 2 [Folsomia candida]OXA57747.1 hypothetical protein Fcan01_07790 [Folsomia candida]
MDNPALEIEETSMSSESTQKMTSSTSSDRDISPKKEQKSPSSDLYYSINDRPPLHLSFALGFQHYLTVAGSSVSVPYILCPAMCMLDDDVGRAQLISTIMLVSGIVTIFQSTFGTRLPIVQGGSFSFITPALAILALPEWTCPSRSYLESISQEARTELWQLRMRELSGAIIVASITEVILGFFGIIGLILKYITPLTVAPAIAMIGLSLFKVSAQHAAANWGISILTIFLIILFTQYLKWYKIPIPFTSNQSGKLRRFPLFEIFPFLLTIIIVWGICAILTATDALPENDLARTDVKLNLIRQTDWFLFPYPFQWGWPTVSVGAVLGMVSGVITGTVESIGDYYACARISGASPPPISAVNRGIFVEGIGCILAGCWGTGNGTTSFSENIGAISVTKVGSRSVIQAAGFLMIIFSLLGKVGAVFVSIPEPIIGGIFCIVFATVAAVGLSNLQGVDLNSSRNIFIIGFSIFFALVMSQWMGDHKDAIDVGVSSINQVITILLTTGMFVGGVLGFILDNTIPGTPKERGLLTWMKTLDDDDSTSAANPDSSYDLPFIGNFIRRVSVFRLFPISPTFHGFKAKHPKLPKVIGKNKVSITDIETAPKIQNNALSRDRLKEIYSANEN